MWSVLLHGIISDPQGCMIMSSVLTEPLWKTHQALTEIIQENPMTKVRRGWDWRWRLLSKMTAALQMLWAVTAIVSDIKNDDATAHGGRKGGEATGAMLAILSNETSFVSLDRHIWEDGAWMLLPVPHSTILSLPTSMGEFIPSRNVKFLLEGQFCGLTGNRYLPTTIWLMGSSLASSRRVYGLSTLPSFITSSSVLYYITPHHPFPTSHNHPEPTFPT